MTFLEKGMSDPDILIIINTNWKRMMTTTLDGMEKIDKNSGEMTVNRTNTVHLRIHLQHRDHKYSNLITNPILFQKQTDGTRDR